MRMSFLALTVVALVASTVTAASAFNYATMSRTVGATIVTDNGNAYLSIEGSDSSYTCMLAWTNGKLDVTFDAGTACAGAGTGINADSIYYFSDVLKITNKGQKALTGLWLNFTADDVIMTKTATSAGTNMATTSGWTRETAVGSLAVGSSVYVSFKIDSDTTNLDTSNSPISKSMTIHARATD